jgi:hypothetical protein
VGEPATPGVMAFIDGRERERRLMMIVRTWTNWNIIRKPLGTSWP